MTEHVETTDLTVEDILGEEPSYHTILQVWREILDAARPGKRDMHMGPRWASRLVQQYPQITYADLGQYASAYYDRICELLDILEFEIGTDDECLKHLSAEEDRAENAEHYLNVLIEWQKALLVWEMGWDHASPTAAVDLAVISEVQRMFFNETGVTALLDQIGFALSDDDQQAITDALRDLAEGEDE